MKRDGIVAQLIKRKNDMKKKVSFSIVLIIAGILIVVINKIIGNFDWHLRSDFIWLASFMITFGVFWLGIPFIKRCKKRRSKNIFIIFWTLFSIIVAFVEFMVLCWIIKTTVIKEIDGIKYCGVEYETNRLRKNVYYYKEYNIFAYHKQKEIIYRRIFMTMMIMNIPYIENIMMKIHDAK